MSSMKSNSLVLLTLSWLCVISRTAAAACQSCLASSMIGATAGVGGGYLKSSSGNRIIGSGTRTSPSSLFSVGDTTKSALTFLISSRIATHFGYSLSAAAEKIDESRSSTTNNGGGDDMANGYGNESESTKSQETISAKKQGSDKTVSAGMVGAIGVYKNYISPLLPPACRFLPTCSQYGVQAIEEFGPGKGVILIAWRLLRCSPFGGRGYDPPKWPPVFYTYGSY